MVDPENLFREFKLLKRCPFDYAQSVWQDCGLASALYAEHHPLGFIKIELTPNVNDMALSLHLWKGVQRTLIHSHHFDMESVVIRGALLDFSYHVTPSETSEFIRFDVNYRHAAAVRNFHSSSQRVAVHHAGSRLISGTSYCIPMRDFHTTRALTRTTVSVVMKRNIGRIGSCFLLADCQPILDQRETGLGREEVLRLLKEESGNV